ncbi:LuxR family transcriptional regulator [Polaribacter sp. SA4-10]|uniref:AAA family ATPase n=1 Tax=Polaribacter sp. SA4-10 TaxID=754397 RepID=UPI000B3C3D1F|nr:AAA family ATPase [Polaribacter sp. SA4-10]ARV06110.1 LuxR family transcriptional regulator [Polaribacter sp. SA4-10]
MFQNKIDVITKDLADNQKLLENKNQESSCLVVKKANTWIEEAKNRPIPNMLFNELWYEKEVCILFADTNLGKSILAVQIADSISRGIAIPGFKLESKPKKVLYLDFELSDKQFENRCSEEYQNHYQFSANFLRAEINTELEIPKEYKGIEDYLCATLDVIIKNDDVSVLIIDNLTFLSSENEKAKDALVLMKTLKKLSKLENLSILVLAHTPKRDESKPISINDLAGSKMLMNFCDSSFAIGTSSQETSLRYIKQIKQRNTEHLYHTDNVIICSVEKDTNFLEFQFIEFGFEKDHLKTYDTSDLEKRDEQMKLFISEGLSNVKIADRLNLSEGAIRKRRKTIGL